MSVCPTIPCPACPAAPQLTVSIQLSSSPSVCLSTHPHTHPSIQPHAHLSIRPPVPIHSPSSVHASPIHLSFPVHTTVCLSILSPMHLSAHPRHSYIPIQPSLYQAPCLSILLSPSLSTPRISLALSLASGVFPCSFQPSPPCSRPPWAGGSSDAVLPPRLGPGPGPLGPMSPH